jgi:hypothetical protein
MPWELAARRRDGTPLGDRAQVQEALAQVFPGITFYRRPSGPEMVRQMHGSAASAVQLEKFAHIRAEYGGAFQGEAFSVEFLLGPEETIDSVTLAVWGDTDAVLHLLGRLKSSTGWSLAQQGLSGWEPYLE